MKNFLLLVLLVAPLLGFSQQKITVPDLDKIYLTGQTNKDWRYDTSYRNDSLNFISTMNGMDFLMRIIVIKDTLAFCDIECTKADFDKFVEDAVSSNPLVKVASFKSETSDAYGYYFKNTNRHLYYSFYYRASGNMLLVVSGVRTGDDPPLEYTLNLMILYSVYEFLEAIKAGKIKQGTNL